MGKVLLYQMVLSKALLDKYKVSDEEAKNKLKKQKDKMGDNFKSTLEQLGLKNEDELKEK